MLSLRCRINANVAELLVIIGYSELGPTFEARPFALSAARSAACLLVRLLLLPHPVPPLAPLPVHPGLASSPVWSFPRLPRCCDSHWRASWWTAPIRSSRFIRFTRDARVSDSPNRDWRLLLLDHQCTLRDVLTLTCRTR